MPFGRPALFLFSAFRMPIVLRPSVAKNLLKFLLQTAPHFLLALLEAVMPPKKQKAMEAISGEGCFSLAGPAYETVRGRGRAPRDWQIRSNPGFARKMIEE